MADFNFNYPDSAYGIPTGAMQSYWRKMRQGGATSGVYVPNYVRKAEMEGMMDSMAKNASQAAQRRLEQKRWEGEMQLKRDIFESDKENASRNRSTAMVSNLATPFVNYYTQKNLLENIYGTNPSGIKKKRTSITDPFNPETTRLGNPDTPVSYSYNGGENVTASPIPSSTPTTMVGGIKSGAENLWNSAGTAIDTYPKSILAGNAVGTAVGKSGIGEPIGKALLFGRGGEYDRRAAAAGATGFASGYALSGGDPWAGVLSAIFPVLANSRYKGKTLFG